MQGNEKSFRDKRKGQRAALVGLMAVLIAFGACGALLGQRITGGIVGIVTDQTGAVVPNAQVTATNELTGVAYTPGHTDNSGYYVIPALPEGTYTVSVEQRGFKTLRRSGIHVGVDQNVRVDMQLAVGSNTQTVTVTEHVPLLNTESASISSQVTHTQIANLPISFGRNVLDFTVLGAGNSSYHSPYGDNNYSINGSPAQTETTMLDGANLAIPGGGAYWYKVRPMVEEVQTIKTENTAYSAEYGGMSTINMTTVSGTNQFHGSAYYYYTNPSLQARNFFQAKVGDFHTYVAGTTIGGPIVKNKTFFTFTYMTNPSTTPQPAIITVPTAAERNGDFSGLPPIYDPLTTAPNPGGSGYVRTTFANNQIPTSRIDPVALKLMQYWPAPNLPGTTNNYNNQLLSDTSITDQYSRNPYYDGKIDENISDRHHLFGRLEYLNPSVTYANQFPGPGGKRAWDQGVNDFWVVDIGDTYSFSPSTLNEFRAYLNRTFSGRTLDNQDYDSQVGLKNFGSGFPVINITGLQSMGLGPGFMPLNQAANASGFSDNITFLRGSHTIKVGGGFRAEESNNRNGTFPQGSFGFTGIFTNNPQVAGAGSGFADFLLGDSSNVSAALPGNMYGFRERNGYLFAQDDIKVLPNLTVNLGLRYERYGGVFEVSNRMINFSPSVTNSVTGTPGGIIFAGVNAPRSFNAPRNNFAPRLGLAYSLGKNTVLRAGAGIFYAENTIGFTQGSNLGFDPLPVTLVTSDQITPAFILQNGLPSPLPFVLPPHTSAIANGQSVGWIPSYSPSPTLYQWSFGIQREIGWGTMVEADYVGTRGAHLWFPRNINQVSPNLLGPGNARNNAPYPQYTGLMLWASDGQSNYNALQLSVTHRLAHGLDLAANYTYSRSLNDTSYAQSSGAAPVQNLYNLAAEWALSDDDTPSLFNLSLIYEIPKWLPGNGFAGKYLARGWQLNNVLHSNAGYPVNPSVSLNQSNAFAGNERPDCIGDPSLSGSQQSITGWFNTSAFQLPAPFTFGSCGRNVLRGPGFAEWDFSLFKNTYFRTPLNESTNIQFRAEFMNVINSVNWGQPNATIGSPAAGHITSETGLPRQIDFGIRFVF